MAEYSRSSDLAKLATRTRWGVDDSKTAFLEWLVLEDRERQEKYVMYREYYDGEHDAMLTERQKKFLELDASQEFSANYCAMVCDEVERRMSVAGFSAEENSELGGQKGLLWRWWRLARMDVKQADVHLPAIRDGDAFVIVGWDSEKSRPSLWPNMAFDGSEGVKVHYSDETGEIEYATRRWLVRSEQPEKAGVRRRMNVYYNDRIERYISDDEMRAGAWIPFTDDGKPGVMEWVHPVTQEPLGVPVFHLKYKSAGYRWGKSILEDVIPMQNALNKAIIDVIAAADTTGFRLYWVAGTDMTDEDGEPISIHPGSMLTSNDPDTKFGYMEGEDLRPLIEVVDMCKVTIAQVSETPLHLFQVSGQNASEGAQKQQEVHLINKAEKWAVSVGNFWEDAMRMAIKLSNAFDGTAYPEDLIIDTHWADMEIRDKQTRRKEIADTAKTWAEAGAGLEQAAIEAGLTEERAKLLAASFISLVGGGLIPGTVQLAREESNDSNDNNGNNDDSNSATESS